MGRAPLFRGPIGAAWPEEPEDEQNNEKGGIENRLGELEGYEPPKSEVIEKDLTPAATMRLSQSQRCVRAARMIAKISAMIGVTKMMNSRPR
jgi:hypothetical protein